MSEEIWRATPRYAGLYEASSLGRIRRVASGQGTRAGFVLKPLVGKRGYHSVNIYFAPCQRRREYVHRLVAEAFHGLSELPLVRHLDDDPANNRPENLRHGTHPENYADAVANNGQWSTRNPPAPYCPNGHEYTPENTKKAIGNGGRPIRKCRVCLRLADRRRYWRRKKAKAA